MAAPAGNLENVAEFIQLAVAPIFLLTAVAATLNVFVARLARIVDRGRDLELKTEADDKARAGELRALHKRARLIYRALYLGVGSAILVCLLMGAAFAGQLFGFNAARSVAVLFMAALLAYTSALMCLLREVFLTLGSFRLDAGAPRK